jgi:signal transduction histidine kinase
MKFLHYFKKFQIQLSLLLVIGVAFLVILANDMSYRTTTQAISATSEAQKTKNALNDLMESLLDAETGQRGFLLTGNPVYLKPYDESTQSIGAQLDQLRNMFSFDPRLLGEFGILSRHVSRKLAELDLTIKMRQAGQEEAWRFVLGTDVGREQMDSVRLQMDKLNAVSQRQMDAGQAQVRRTLLTSRIGIIALALLALLAFLMYMLKTKALLNSTVREQESLSRERDQLDLQVRERTANLAELATHLQNVREDERAHLARELHDELGALLTAAKLDVARLKSRIGQESPEAQERLAHLTTMLNDGIALKRRIIEDLRPSALTHMGLVASLEILVHEFEKNSGIPVQSDLEAVELSEPAQLTLYRLVQESFTNIAKYAKAKQISFSLEKLNGYVTVEIKDDGIGFDSLKVYHRSYGIQGMQHRVEALGGKLTVDSAPQQGTRINASLPTH